MLCLLLDIYRFIRHGETQGIQHVVSMYFKSYATNKIWFSNRDQE